MQISDKASIQSLIAEVSGQKNMRSYQMIYVRMTGSITTAIFLSECVYWADWANKQGRENFYRSYKEWLEDTGLTEREVDRARRECDGVVVTTLKKANGTPTLHYSVNWDELEKWIRTKRTNGLGQNVLMGKDTTSQSLTEETTEFNSEETTKQGDSDFPEEPLNEKKYFTARDVDKVICQVAKFPTLPVQFMPYIDKVIDMLSALGWDDTKGRLQRAHDSWIKQIRKENGANWRASNPGWIDLAIANEIVGVPEKEKTAAEIQMENIRAEQERARQEALDAAYKAHEEKWSKLRGATT